MTNQLRLPFLLGVAGATPLNAGATIIRFGPANFAQSPMHAFVAYVAVILSFLGGIQWGMGVAISGSAPKSAQPLFLLPVVPSLLAWAMLFVVTTGARIIIAIFLFACVWLTDAFLHPQDLIPKWIFRLRRIVSPIVIGSLAAALIAA